MIEIDGNYLEGGGQILRTAISLSMLTSKSFEMKDIRKGREKPGIKAQHLSAIKIAKELCNPDVEGGELASMNIRFIPRKYSSNHLTVDIGTAGSITLLFQSVLLPLVFGTKSVKLNITGGTDVSWSQPTDHFSNVFLPQLKKYADIEFKLLRRGYYPAGNGVVEMSIKPKYKISDFSDFNKLKEHLHSSAKKINLTKRGKLIHIRGVSHASIDLQNSSVAERQARAAEIALKQLDVPVLIRIEYVNSISTGSGITLWAVFGEDMLDCDNPTILGSDSLGGKGISAEAVGKEAGNRLLAEINSGAVVDRYTSDQLIPYMALVGNSAIKPSYLTNHALTNIYAVEKFLDKCFSSEGVVEEGSCENNNSKEAGSSSKQVSSNSDSFIRTII